MFDLPINWWAILVAAVANMAIGAVWYSPVLFGKTWSRAVGKSMDDMRANAAKGYVVTTLAALVASFVLAHFVIYANAITVTDGLVTGFWVWLGFIAATTVSDYLFAGRKLALYAVNVGYYLVAFLVMGAILAVWQ